MSKSILIIGAGPAGLTAAYKLAQAGYRVSVYEAGAHVGGLARSFALWGQTVDCGPHRFFSNDKIVNDFFKEVVKDDFVNVERLTRIYYNNHFFYYPLKVSNVLLNIGPVGIFQILWSYALTRINPIKNPQTFEDWVIDRFGKKLYSIFFKNYSEKLWGIPCAKIDADWAAQRIKKFSLVEAVKTALFGNKGNKHKTLVDQFAYPKHGTGSIYTKMKAFIEQNGGAIHLNTPVKRILANEEKAYAIELNTGEVIHADEIISTMPLTLMVKGLPAVPQPVVEACNKLYYRNTILVYIEVADSNLFPDNWVYVHSPEVIHGRITNFRNWSPQLYGDRTTTILCLEYWCFDNDEIWSKGQDYFGKLAEQEVKKIKLVKPETKILNSEVIKLPHCYPVYETGYMQHVKIIQQYLETVSNLRAIGRYGSFKYNNQDHSILMGLLAAREIIKGSNEDLWAINTDSEYQEKGEALSDR